ncbi:unnamed protein product [Phyllotreta striolata]|uniref:10 kDa heat shock protein, mitochondrial n=1 Tax=Phyllotreta striolata TaxID=444603 RepID=A0A9N9TKX4_PHYSR|nr:unnamed protein product [Phyllotreta striolata]
MAASPQVKSLTRKLVPLLNRVLIKKPDPVKQSKGGILIPETKTQSKYNKGVVVAVGPGKYSSKGKVIPMNVYPGDEVILEDIGGISVDLDEGTHYIYKDTAILAKINKNVQA